MADDPVDPIETTPKGPDLSAFVPEEFKGEDGAWDTAGFRAKFDDLAASKAMLDERAAALPKEAKDYAFAVPEDHVFPEGFDPATMATKDENGNDVEFDVNSMIQADDPDIPLLQEVMKEFGADPAMMGKLASIMANREIRTINEGIAKAAEETAKLGPDAKSRFGNVERTLKAKLPDTQVTAIMDGIVSADGLRGIETLLKGTTAPGAPPASKSQDWSEKSPMDRVMSGLQQRNKSA